MTASPPRGLGQGPLKRQAKLGKYEPIQPTKRIGYEQFPKSHQILTDGCVALHCLIEPQCSRPIQNGCWLASTTAPPGQSLGKGQPQCHQLARTQKSTTLQKQIFQREAPGRPTVRFPNAIEQEMIWADSRAGSRPLSDIPPRVLVATKKPRQARWHTEWLTLDAHDLWLTSRSRRVPSAQFQRAPPSRHTQKPMHPESGATNRPDRTSSRFVSVCGPRDVLKAHVTPSLDGTCTRSKWCSSFSFDDQTRILGQFA